MLVNADENALLQYWRCRKFPWGFQRRYRALENQPGWRSPEKRIPWAHNDPDGGGDGFCYNGVWTSIITSQVNLSRASIPKTLIREMLFLYRKRYGYSGHRIWLSCILYRFTKDDVIRLLYHFIQHISAQHNIECNRQKSSLWKNKRCLPSF